MLIKSLAAAAVTTLVLSSQAIAWDDAYRGPSTGDHKMSIHPYHGPNYCPIGLQPVVLGGVVCCGTPNSNMTYAEMMAHPMPHPMQQKANRAHSHRKTHTHVKRHSH